MSQIVGMHEYWREMKSAFPEMILYNWIDNPEV